MNFLLKFSSKIIIYLFFYLIFNSYNSVNAYEVGEDFNYKLLFEKTYDCSQKANRSNDHQDYSINYYHTNIWNWKAVGDRFKLGKTLGVCIKKYGGAGWFWTASKVGFNQYGKPTSWVQPTYQIGKSPWFRNLDSDKVKDFPIKINTLRALNFYYLYTSKGEGLYNHNLTLWFKKEINSGQPYLEVMLKFNGPQIKDESGFSYCNKPGQFQRLKELKLEKINYDVCLKTLERNLIESDTDGGTRKFATIVMLPTNINQENEKFEIDIDIMQVIKFLIENNQVSENDILPGLELNTEIWYGREELNIEKLNYKIIRKNN